MKKRSHRRASPSPSSGNHRTATAKLAPLPTPSGRATLYLPGAVSADDRCEREPYTDPLTAAATRSAFTKFPRLQTLASLAHDHVAAMHNGDFVARSRERWQQLMEEDDDRDLVSDGMRAFHISRESAALVVQSAWRRSAAVRLRTRLVRSMWQEHINLAAWLTRDREQLQLILNTLTQASQYPLSSTRRVMQSLPQGGHLSTLRGAYRRLPALLLATWLCFAVGLRRHSRFLRRPAPAILHAVHIPIRTTCRIYSRLWRATTQRAARSLQCRMRSFLARCVYWRLLRAHRRGCAAVRLQSLYRAWVARCLVKRRRWRRAAMRIQCVWRCHHARQCLRQRRVARVATHFIWGVTRHAVERTAITIVHAAASQIQRTFRGQRARSQFRVLVMRRHSQQQWHQNPSRGYRLFALRSYLDAAVHLEQCFRQGIFHDEAVVLEKTKLSLPKDQHYGQHRRLPSGSRLAYSFSEAPTPLASDLVHGGAPRRRPNGGRPASPSHTNFGPPNRGILPLVQQLEFWQTYALAHWFSFHSNGDPLHLRQARVGFETLLRLAVASSHERQRSTVDTAEFQFLLLHARVCLVHCVYWAQPLQGSSSDNDTCLSLCHTTLEELTVLPNLSISSMIHHTTMWRAQLLMIRAALYLDKQDVDACRAQLQTLLVMTQRGECSLYEEIDLRFLLAIVLLSVPKEFSTNQMDEAEDHLKYCYQAVELWPGVGFYHGDVSSSDAARCLHDEPVGSFLLHRDLVDTSSINSADMEAQADGVSAPSARDRKLLLKVKLSDDPCKVSSLRIHYEDGHYHMKKLPESTFFSVHALIQQLPPAAGLSWSLGVRRGVYVKAVEAKLSSRDRLRLARRTLLLPWDHWHWRVSTASTRHNDCWGTLCQLFAVRLEAVDAYAMAARIARDGVHVARDRALRAELFFTIGRVHSHLQHRVEGTLALKQAAIESARLPHFFNSNYAAVAHAIARMGAQRHAFTNQLARVAKLERMCVKAWAFDSCSPTLRGRPFCEALLLQRVDHEMTHEKSEIADTFFLRSLLRAHLKAFVTKEASETTHVELAFACVQRLFERYQELGRTTDNASRLHACVDHVVSPCHYKQTQHASDFSFYTLLLTWHRLPFFVAFEMAEVFYRWPLMSCPTLIDVYESLYGRLRSSKPRNWAYAAYEELLLVRLAFLYAQRASDAADQSTPVLLATKAVEIMDELIGLRRLRALGSNLTVSVKRIQWPTSSLHFPLRFSLPELIFIRGYLWNHVSTFDRSSKKGTHTKNAWRDYDVLHRELLALVASEQERVRETNQHLKKLTGVRVLVGDTMDVMVSDMLYSKPFVIVQCETQQHTTQHAATWMNQLSPGWNEYVEIDMTSSKARLTVTLMNRSTRLRRRHLGGDQVLGFIEVHAQEILANSNAYQRPQWYDLVCRETPPKPGTRPRIRLAFSLIMQAADPSLQTRVIRTLRGNWDVSQLEQYLHGDLRRFVMSPWVWRWYAHRWLGDKEFSIAAWFLQRAIELGKAETNGESVISYAFDLVDLAKCYRATMGSAWLAYARAILDEALGILQPAYEASGSSDLALYKHLNGIAKMVGTGKDHPPTPLATELAKQIPASSHWIAMRRPQYKDKGSGIYYFNEDTCEQFNGIESEPHMHAPLEWEADSERVVMTRDPLRPHRVVILTIEMKARVAFHCTLQSDLHAQDPHQWVAVFNPRKQLMQFLSLPPAADNESTLEMTMDQPPTYAMLADDFLVYHVLIVQDAFRAYQLRRQRQRRLRGLLNSAFALVCEHHAAQTRLVLRADFERKQQLNCLHITIEKATKVRAMDLVTSDPFVVLELVDADGDVVATGETSVKRNTLYPQWHEAFDLHYAYVDHMQQHLQNEIPRLRLRVLDHDIVRTHQRDDAVVNPEGVTEKQRKHDFLGLAETAIEPLEHGKCVTADLDLHDEDGRTSISEDDDEAVASSSSRGTLTITVQWVYDPDADPGRFQPTRRNAVKPMLLVRPRKRTRPKPTLSPAMHDLLDTVKLALADVVMCMSDSSMGALLDQLVRLFKRWRIAQAAGRTADEAKLMEQRLCAATTAPQPFAIKYATLVASVGKAHKAVNAVVDAIEGPIREWMESCDKLSEEALTATFTRAVTAIREADDLPTAWDSRVQAFPVCMDRVLSQSETIATWRRELLVLLHTFYDSSNLVWDASEAAISTQEQFAQIRMTLQSALGDGISRPSTANTNTITSRPSSATTTAATTPSVESQSPSVVALNAATDSVPATTNTAVAKRMARIERERRKAQKQR